MIKRISLTSSTKKCSIRNIMNYIYRQFANKYSYMKFIYEDMLISNLVWNKQMHIISVMREYVIWENTNEYIRRFYMKHEAIPRICKIVLFYETYSKLFPNYICLPESIYLYKNIRRKQKMIDAFNEIQKEEEDNRKQIANNIYNHKHLHNNNVFTDKIQQSINNYYPSFSVSNIINNDNSNDNNVTNVSIMKMLNHINNKQSPLKHNTHCIPTHKTKQKRSLLQKKKIYLNNLDNVNNIHKHPSSLITVSHIHKQPSNITIHHNTLTHTVISKVNISKHNKQTTSTVSPLHKNTLHCATVSSTNKQKLKRSTNVKQLSPLQQKGLKRQLIHTKSQCNYYNTNENKDKNGMRKYVASLKKSESGCNGKMFKQKEEDEKMLMNILRYKYKLFTNRMKDDVKKRNGGRNIGSGCGSSIVNGSVCLGKARNGSSRNVGKDGLCMFVGNKSEDVKGGGKHWRRSSFEIQLPKSKGQKITVNRKVNKKKVES